jgi:hypothetical protein
MSETDDYTPILHRPNRNTVVPCCAVIFGIVAIVVYYYVSSHARYQVIGKVDPATKYRITYTVSSRYRNMDMSDPRSVKTSHELEYWSYMPTPRAAPVRWFYSWILRRTDAATEPDANADMGGELKAHEIQQITFLGKTPNGHRVGSDGYIELGDIAGLGEYVSHEKSVISKCPVTWYSFDRTGATLRYYNLYIRPKGQPITYMFAGISDTGQEPNDVLDELNAIRDSITIEKVR